MSEIKDILKRLRAERGYSQARLAGELGAGVSTVASWEVGKRFPSRENMEQLADIFNVDLAYLYGKTEVRQRVHYDSDGNKMVAIKQLFKPPAIIPVLGRVAAGIPITATENIIDTEEISDEMARDGEYFGLLVKGDSMEPAIRDGDVVIVRKQETADDGDVVIALINGDDAVVKRLKRYADSIALISINPAYDPMIFNQDAVASTPVQIIGKVKELRRKF